MFVSIIVAVYNTQRYLNYCINSILAQSLRDYEVILVDDGSTDSSGSICDAYARSNACIQVMHQDNKGQGAARNRGIDAASGDYILFVDSDDWIEPDLLEVLHGIAGESGPELIVFGYRMHSEWNLYKKHTSCVHTEKSRGSRTIWQDYLAGDKIMPVACNKLYKRELFQKARFPEIRMREDLYLLTRLLRHVEEIAYTTYVGYNQLIRCGSTEQKGFRRDMLVTVDIWKETKAYIRDRYPELEPYAERRLIDARLDCIANIVMHFKKHKYPLEYRQLKSELEAAYRDIGREPEFYQAQCADIQRLLFHERAAVFRWHMKGARRLAWNLIRLAYGSCRHRNRELI